jgi:hypothetical protein
VLIPMTAFADAPSPLPQFGRAAAWSASTEGSEARAGIALCTRGARTASASSRHVKGLWGDGKGNFQTIGHNGKRGVVAVRDFTRRANVTLRAGQTYLALAR